ncbi:phage tail sheath family protein [Paenibacillus sp. FSL W7-1279]|uniref:phage tail sheath family protein n=1 Tax=Paenibacillus sp. FSL W7-1279 TaxID=2921697 RepID=UPI0030DBF02E
MAGGTWKTQNKDRAGVYIVFETTEQTMGTLGERGVASLPLSLSWGPSKQVITVEAGADTKDVLGYDISAPELLPLREALKRASKVLLYRLNAGTAATATNTGLTVTAIHGGLRGNEIRIIVQNNIDDPAKFDVITLIAGEVMDTQIVAEIEDLVENNWVKFSGTGAPDVTAGLNLTGGADGTVTNGDHTDYLTKIEGYDFNTIGLLSTDATLKPVYTAAIKRMRDQEGKKVQVVMADYAVADYEGVISVKNGVILSDGTILDKVKAVAWVAGATAGAAADESLTYSAYDDAVDVDVRYTNSEIEAALRGGEFLFIHSYGRAVVEQDINTFRSFTATKGRERSKNRVLRVLDSLANDLKRIFEQFYIGKVDNNVDGRALFRKEIVTYIDTLVGIGAVQNFDAQTDVTVQQGKTADSVYVELRVQPVDAIEKIYMRVFVR